MINDLIFVMLGRVNEGLSPVQGVCMLILTVQDTHESPDGCIFMGLFFLFVLNTLRILELCIAF